MRLCFCNGVTKGYCMWHKVLVSVVQVVAKEKGRRGIRPRSFVTLKGRAKPLMSPSFLLPQLRGGIIGAGVYLRMTTSNDTPNSGG